MHIRPYQPQDAGPVLQILMPVFRAGDTYAVDADLSEAETLAYWTGPEKAVFVAEEAGEILGTYYRVRNQKGGGSHVCNCGYVTGAAARGKGVAREMLAYSLREAKEAGFRAMQFNFVVASNLRAIDIWQRAGFEIVGRLPGAFAHPQEGFVDALVMYRDL